MLVTIASCAHQSQYNQWNIITLEIFYLLFRGVPSPDVIIRRSEQVNRAIRSDKLSQLLQAETIRKRLETRKGATRHSRFGTTLTIENGKDRVVLHRQAAVATAHVNPGGLMDVGRKGKSKKAKRENDLAPAADYRPDAMNMLQAVALTFLESAFNRECTSHGFLRQAGGVVLQPSLAHYCATSACSGRKSASPTTLVSSFSFGSSWNTSSRCTRMKRHKTSIQQVMKRTISTLSRK